MKFSEWIFRLAGISGLVILLPLYFLEKQAQIAFQTSFDNAKFYYGFLGVAIAWQIMFLIISKNPLKYRVMMIPAILGKFAYGLAILILFALERVNALQLYFGILDLIFGILFIAAFIKTDGVKYTKRIII